MEPITVGPVSLPTVEHALTVSSKDIFQVPERTIDWSHGKKSTVQTMLPRLITSYRPPYKQMIPLVLSLEIDRMQLMAQLFSLKILPWNPIVKIPRLLIESLLDAMVPIYESRLNFVYQCQQFKENSLHSITGIDERVSTVYYILHLVRLDFLIAS